MEAMNYAAAVKLATTKHEGQYRKISGLPYITHPLAVADKFDDEDRKIVAVLHDTIEDTDLSISELVGLHGLELRLADAVEAITRSDGESYLDFILRCNKNEIARDVKIEDIKHNMSDLVDGCLKDKYMMALYIMEI